MRGFWVRSMFAGAVAGLLVGLVFGLPAARLVMRLAFLDTPETAAFQTTAGAFVGEFTRDGMVELAQGSAGVGVLLGLVYPVGRAFLSPGLGLRTGVYVCVATLLGTAFAVGGSIEDFSFLPVTRNVLMFAAMFALAALPLPWLVERYVPDRPHSAPALGWLVVALTIGGSAALLVISLVGAYRQPNVLGAAISSAPPLTAANRP